MTRAENLGLLPNEKIERLGIDNGSSCEVFIPRSHKERVPYVSDLCEFTPVGWARIADIWYPLGFKVVTYELKSLGLRRNPNIMAFPLGEWVCLPEEQVLPGMDDWGGIWTALKQSSIKTLRDHCSRTWGMETRGFLTAIHNPVFSNSYRIKSQGVMLLQEINQ